VETICSKNDLTLRAKAIIREMAQDCGVTNGDPQGAYQRGAHAYTDIDQLQPSFTPAESPREMSTSNASDSGNKETCSRHATRRSSPQVLSEPSPCAIVQTTE